MVMQSCQAAEPRGQHGGRSAGLLADAGRVRRDQWPGSRGGKLWAVRLEWDAGGARRGNINLQGRQMGNFNSDWGISVNS